MRLKQNNTIIPKTLYKPNGILAAMNRLKRPSAFAG